MPGFHFIVAGFECIHLLAASGGPPIAAIVLKKRRKKKHQRAMHADLSRTVNGKFLSPPSGARELGKNLLFYLKSLLSKECVKIIMEKLACETKIYVTCAECKRVKTRRKMPFGYIIWRVLARHVILSPIVWRFVLL